MPDEDRGAEIWAMIAENNGWFRKDDEFLKAYDEAVLQAKTTFLSDSTEAAKYHQGVIQAIINPECLQPAPELSAKWHKDLSFCFAEKIMHIWEAFSNSMDPLHLHPPTNSPPVIPEFNTFTHEEIPDTLRVLTQDLWILTMPFLACQRESNNLCHSCLK